MLGLTRLSLATAGTALMATLAAGREFYVDPDKGDDGHDGASPAAAWKTLDRVNSAELAPGDTVRFTCGGVWRGSLLPKSGSDGAPITYTSYGNGAKPAFLGSVACNRAEDWVRVEPGLWSTRPPQFSAAALPVDMRRGRWWRHHENGADVAVTKTSGTAGDSYQLTCRANGTRSNHIQFWGPFPDWDAVGDAVFVEFRFRARCTAGFSTGTVRVSRGRSPWTTYGTGNSVAVGPAWEEHAVRFGIRFRGDTPRLHFLLGGRLPAGSVFEFQPLELVAVNAEGGVAATLDVGNVIFDHGRACGWKKWALEDLTAPLDYVYDGTRHRVVLRCDRNPGAAYRSIELAQKRHIVNQTNVHHVVYDGLALKYGAAHGFGGGNTHHLTIRNCDISYIGGGHQHTNRGRPVRYGNGIEFWGAAHDNLVEGCRVWEIYDAALTNQGRGPDSRQINITYRHNIVWNAEYSFEYWNNPETAETRNIRFVNNTCVNAGGGWAHSQRPDPNGSHLMMYTNTARTSGIEITRNIFVGSTEWGSRFSAGWETLPTIDRNLWHEPDGYFCWFFKEKLPAADVEQYRAKTGFDEHSVFADPRFVDASARDFRLRADSPARRVLPGGDMVGARALWNAGR